MMQSINLLLKINTNTRKKVKFKVKVNFKVYYIEVNKFVFPVQFYRK